MAIRLRNLTIDKKVLVLAEVVMAALCFYRAYSFLVTGFFVSDEYGYYYNAVNGAIYGNRWFYGWLNIYLFRIFQIRSTDSFVFFLPFYLFLWSSLTLYAFYRLLKIQSHSSLTVALSVLSSLFLVSFVLLSVGFLTEGVGLCMAILGIYCLVSFLNSRGYGARFVWLTLAAFFLGFAGGTREPYVALEIGGIGLVVVAALRHPVKNSASHHDAKSLIALSMICFLLPTALMLYANTSTTSTVSPLATGFVQSLFTNPSNNASTVTLQVTGTKVVTQDVTQTVTQTIGENTTTRIVTTRSTFTTTTVETSLQTGYVPFWGRFLVTNTLAIFIGGIFLGWGPIAFIIGVAGFVLLLKASIRRDSMALALFTLAICALGSDFIVSYIFATIPDYLTFRNYSTIIRFSGTALPAFFLTAPLFLAIVAKRKRRVVSFLGVILVSLLVLLPLYQVFAISNLGYTTVSPFGLDYRSPAVQVRDYIKSHPADAPFHILGVPYGWYFTTGIVELKSVDVYSPTPEHTLSPPLNYTAFLARHWTEFYVYSSSNFIYERATSPYLLQFISAAGRQAANQTTPFKIVSSTTVIKNPDFLLTKVDLSWSNP